MSISSDEINRCRFLYLKQITEPQDNQLRIFIEEARASGIPDNLTVGGVTVTNTQSIISDDSCCAFQLLWNDYIAYSIRNESFVSADNSEQFEGRLFCIYSASHYLEFLRAATFADSSYPGPFQHYGINCLNHIIDVVSTSPPQIIRVR